MEDLSSLIAQADNRQLLTRLKVCIAPFVTQPFFVDDDLIFAKVVLEECNNSREVLCLYGSAFDQVVNFEKSVA